MSGFSVVLKGTQAGFQSALLLQLPLPPPFQVEREPPKVQAPNAAVVDMLYRIATADAAVRKRR
jgi:hypothetical protein